MNFTNWQFHKTERFGNINRMLTDHTRLFMYFNTVRIIVPYFNILDTNFGTIHFIRHHVWPTISLYHSVLHCIRQKKTSSSIKKL